MDNDNKKIGCYYIKNHKENKGINKAFIKKTIFFLSNNKSFTIIKI